MFKRITDNQIPSNCESLRDVFDEIRMRDAEGYPQAYIKYGNLTLEFKRAGLRKGCIEADVKILWQGNSDILSSS